MDPTAALVSVVRSERTRLVATLVRRYGFDLAEEAVDTAISSALEQWPISGTPASPRAWLLSVAKRRAIDHVRHRVKADAVHATLETTSAGESDDADAPDRDLPDDRLRLVFTCCHPAIAHDAQVALALRWISGLSTEDVARAFCVPVPTMAQRLTRAKSKIEAARIPYEVPERRELPERVSTVLEVVYAIFNEGYVATVGTALQRTDLAEEAIRLAELVVLLLPESAEARGMLALLHLVHARRHARVSSDGELVSLEEQDRTVERHGRRTRKGTARRSARFGTAHRVRDRSRDPSPPRRSPLVRGHRLPSDSRPLRHAPREDRSRDRARKRGRRKSHGRRSRGGPRRSDAARRGHGALRKPKPSRSHSRDVP